MTVRQYIGWQRAFLVIAAAAVVNFDALNPTLAWIPQCTLIVAGTCGLALNAYAVFVPPRGLR